MARFAQYVLHEHNSYGAAKLHYDLRIAYPFPRKGNPVASWAIPKHRIPGVHEKVLAVKGHDHEKFWLTVDNYDIPEGEYGHGHVKILQKGKLEILGWSNKQVTFISKGRIMNGKFTLVYPSIFKAQDVERIKKNPRSGEQWLFIRAEDVK